MWNVLYAIDFAVIPTILDDINIQALPKTLNNLRRLEAEFDRKPTLLGILPTAFRQGVSNQEKFLVELRRRFGSGVFDPIPQTTDVQEAYAARLPLHRYNASSMAVKPYAAFTAEVMNRAT
jgi:cellulose biosynthesis protein BcsQ